VDRAALDRGPCRAAPRNSRHHAADCRPMPAVRQGPVDASARGCHRRVASALAARTTLACPWHTTCALRKVAISLGEMKSKTESKTEIAQCADPLCKWPILSRSERTTLHGWATLRIIRPRIQLNTHRMGAWKSGWLRVAGKSCRTPSASRLVWRAGLWQNGPCQTDNGLRRPFSDTAGGCRRCNSTCRRCSGPPWSSPPR
jgi:hypothetical protein